MLRRRGHFQVDARLAKRLPRLLVATLAMVPVLIGLGLLLAPWLGGALVARAGALALLLGAGGIAYLGAARLLGLFTLAELKAQFSRKGTSA